MKEKSLLIAKKLPDGTIIGYRFVDREMEEELEEEMDEE